MKTATVPPRTRYVTTATYADIKAHINDLSKAMMPPVAEWSAREDRHNLTVYVANIADAVDWCDAFGVPNDHRIATNVPDQGKRVYSGFVAWRGWHVGIHGADPLHVPAAVVDELVLAGVR